MIGYHGIFWRMIDFFDKRKFNWNVQIIFTESKIHDISKNFFFFDFQAKKGRSSDVGENYFKFLKIEKHSLWYHEVFSEFILWIFGDESKKLLNPTNSFDNKGIKNFCLKWTLVLLLIFIKINHTAFVALMYNVREIPKLPQHNYNEKKRDWELLRRLDRSSFEVF